MDYYHLLFDALLEPRICALRSLLHEGRAIHPLSRVVQFLFDIVNVDFLLHLEERKGSSHTSARLHVQWAVL